jgi:hypothetical protein
VLDEPLLAEFLGSALFQQGYQQRIGVPSANIRPKFSGEG